MRLINTKTLKLEEFNEVNRPPYAILSHTWGDQEVTFEDMQDDSGKYVLKTGYPKILQTCKVARGFNIDYAWVDTCCIDKSSSAELSEAINSMFRWYHDAEICYAYLPDVDGVFERPWTIVESRWFTRGWTLQELIAPRKLVFYAPTWELIDSRSSLSGLIAAGTGIDKRLLQDDRDDLSRILRNSSIAQRMSWASRRETTRTEDLAYCLLGIFDINMPLLYGEGSKAFTRLQEEIIRHTDDQSIFAWGLSSDNTHDPRSNTNTSVLAPSPMAFSESQDIISVDTCQESAPFSITNRGIRIDLRIRRTFPHTYGIMSCRRKQSTELLAIVLDELPGNRFYRIDQRPISWTSHLSWKRTPNTTVYLMTTPPPEMYRIPPGSFFVKPMPEEIFVQSVTTGYTWSPATGLVTMDKPDDRFGSEVELHLILEPKMYGRSRRHKGSTTVSIWVRRPSWYPPETEWVTYDVRYYDQLRNRSESFGPFFAKVEKQIIFGQRVIVVEVFCWEKEEGIVKRLQWTQMRLGRLLDRCIFGVIGVPWSWLIIFLLKMITSVILFRPVLTVAVILIIWSIRDSEFELSLIEEFKESIFSSIEEMKVNPAFGVGSLRGAAGLSWY
ncbi:hypothetical protein CDV31_004792 [Fusarium ambrosium]|uniref:Uncharacterized protein n=1 Tax=Fusarium ambrosium TaxID=131363 RepID=A0A428UNQ8_9HYPO|nr:hypothetical protein CDV31_004792 [Fusarium ambrosium]